MCMRFRSVFNNTENAAFPHLYPFFLYYRRYIVRGGCCVSCKRYVCDLFITRLSSCVSVRRRACVRAYVSDYKRPGGQSSLRRRGTPRLQIHTYLWRWIIFYSVLCIRFVEYFPAGENNIITGRPTSSNTQRRPESRIIMFSVRFPCPLTLSVRDVMS